MTILDLTGAIIYIALTVYYVIKLNKYPRQVLGGQSPDNVIIPLIVIWYACTFMIVVAIIGVVLSMVPWNKKII